jgi:hypothetical protein
MEMSFSDPYFVPKDLYEAFDVPVYFAFHAFLAKILSGYRTFVFLIDGIPIFNRDQFLASKSHDDGTREFVNFFLDTMMFDHYLQEEFGSKRGDDFNVSTRDSILLTLFRISSFRRIQVFWTRSTEGDWGVKPRFSRLLFLFFRNLL